MAARQRQRAASYWLILQPDHAALSGALAANFRSPHFPQLEAAVVRAIALHDSGWSIFEHERAASADTPLTEERKPRSFIEIAPADFTRAWAQSINRAEQDSTVGGLMVSRHFAQLGEGRLKQANDTEADQAILASFLEHEQRRQQWLLARDARTSAELDALVSVLQFCDLLSLYLCCGATDEVEFPQRFNSRAVRLSYTGGAFVFDPSPFVEPVSFGVQAKRYPSAEPHTTTLPLLLR